MFTRVYVIVFPLQVDSNILMVLHENDRFDRRLIKNEIIIKKRDNFKFSYEFNKKRKPWSDASFLKELFFLIIKSRWSLYA